MGRWIEVISGDGHRLPAWEATPDKPARGAIVVIQEIFGVNSHIRSIADGFAADGYHAIAPALFDRVQPGFESGYDDEDIKAGRALAQKAGIDDVMKDLAATVKVASGAGAGGAGAGGAGSDAAPGAAGRVGIVGYCWGGTMSWVAAARVQGLACAVVYYGGNIANYVGEQPQCPVLCHFGKRDRTPSPEQARSVLDAHPSVEGHFYDAGHGFNCDQRASYDADASRLARQRTLEFFAKHVG
ncbi:MAG: dienelactone hydrolase family protein [Burkholderiaceae bacterium]|nr:dienelactone hydrolase family protein [Burkholderiaceae bacterium]